MHIGIALTASLAHNAGVAVNAAAISVTACLAILLFGLPHGTLDFELLRRAMNGGMHRFRVALAMYFGCAAAMYCAWRAAPELALLVFLVLSTVHFAEDYADNLPALFSLGTVAAILTSPALGHHDALLMIFSTLSGDQTANAIVDAARLIAPVATALAVTGMAWQWSDGRRIPASMTALALLGMLVLPPVIGFALFFCLLHSPLQFKAGLAALRWRNVSQWYAIVLPLTLAGLGIAAIIFVETDALIFSQKLVAATFMTLSVLTLPHIAVPLLMRRFVALRRQ